MNWGLDMARIPSPEVSRERSVVLLAVAALGLVVAGAGCRTEKRMVITRLPRPAYVNFAPRVEKPPPADEKKSRPVSFELESTWLPPTGITRDWDCIVIHHSLSSHGSVREIDDWHRAQGWEGCGYDFVIGNGSGSPDGYVEASDRWRRQEVGAHARVSRDVERARGLRANHYNEHGIGICVIGDFERDYPSERQMTALARLVRFLMDECGIPETRLYAHRDLKPTRCPGKHFSMWDLRRRVRALNFRQ
jgi:hypothetical protein